MDRQQTAARGLHHANWVLPLLAAALLAIMAPPAAAGSTDITAWITEELDGKQSPAASRQRSLARSATLSEDDDEQPLRGRRGHRGKRLASLGPSIPLAKQPSLTGGITWQASSGCLSGQLASVVADVAASFGPVRVSSTCRSRGRNARVGGARRSHHLTGNAVDFRVFGNVSAVSSYLRGHGSVGGLKHYGGGLFHIDTGARRPM